MVVGRGGAGRSHPLGYTRRTRVCVYTAPQKNVRIFKPFTTVCRNAPNNAQSATGRLAR